MKYPELGMEAIWKIEVEDFPAFILVYDKGNDFPADLQSSQRARAALYVADSAGGNMIRYLCRRIRASALSGIYTVVLLSLIP